MTISANAGILDFNDYKSEITTTTEVIHNNVTTTVETWRMQATATQQHVPLWLILVVSGSLLVNCICIISCYFLTKLFGHKNPCTLFARVIIDLLGIVIGVEPDSERNNARSRVDEEQVMPTLGDHSLIEMSSLHLGQANADVHCEASLIDLTEIGDSNHDVTILDG